jgi:hypothetical protein
LQIKKPKQDSTLSALNLNIWETFGELIYELERQTSTGVVSENDKRLSNF